MSFIPGKFLDEKVINQIKTRQDLLDRTFRFMDRGGSPEAFSWFSRKMPFIKMTSAINVRGSVDPATQFTLDNGVSKSTGAVPGYEETSLGQRPVPGITSLNLHTHNRFGSLRTATVTFEVHAVEQLDEYEQLFMRPGYSVLLEWGHGVYLDTSNDTVELGQVTELLSDRFLSKQGLSTKLDIYREIQKLREKYHYNYDGMYGLIKNFSWNLRPDGGYTCSVDIVSIGTVLESLEINAGVTEKDIKSRLRSTRKEVAEESVAQEQVVAESIWDDLIPEPTQEESNFLKLLELINPSTAQRGSRVFFGKSTYFGTDAQLRGVPTGDTVYEVLPDSLQFRALSKGEVDKFSPADFRDTNVYKAFSNFTSELIDIQGEKRRYKISISPDIDPIKYSYTTEGSFNGGVSIPGSTRYSWYYLFDITRIDIPAEETSTQDNAIQETEEQVNIDLNQVFRDYHPELDSYVSYLLAAVKSRIKKFEKEANRYTEYVVSYGKGTLRPLPTSYNICARRMKPSEGGTQESKDSDEDYYYYMQLGAFLDLLNQFIPSTNGGEKLLQFHTSKEVRHKYKTLESQHASIDISKCILPLSYKVQDSAATRDDILEIFVEINYLDTVVRNNLIQGNLRAYDLVTTVLQDITVATGQINFFEPQYFEETFKFHIVDREVIDPDGRGDQSLRFNLFGKNSALRNVNLVSKLSPAIGTQLAIAAQSDPFSNGIEGTGWARFNKGLIDRYIPTKDIDRERLIKQQEEKEKKTQSDFARVILYLLTVYGADEESKRFEQAGLGVNLPQVASEYKTYCAVRLAQQVKRTGQSFGTIIPYELGLTLDGISGVNVMETFLVNEQILPRAYRSENGEGVGFLITGLQHTVDQNGWNTTIKSQIYTTSAAGAPVTGELLFDNIQPEAIKEAIKDKPSFEDFVSNTPWSAAFIVYCVTKRGVNFPRSAAHTGYAQAIRNGGYPFTALDPATTKLKRGDIIIKNRSSNTLKFSSKTWSGYSHGDIVNTVTATQAKIIGGNVGDTVTAGNVALSDSKLINVNKGIPGSYFVILRPNNSTDATKIANEAVKQFKLIDKRKETDKSIAVNLDEYYRSANLNPPSIA